MREEFRFNLTEVIKQQGSQTTKKVNNCANLNSPILGEGRISKRGTSFRNSGEGYNPHARNDNNVHNAEKNLVTYCPSALVSCKSSTPHPCPLPAGEREHLAASSCTFQVSVILNLVQDLDETLKHRGQSDVQGDGRRKVGMLCAFTKPSRATSASESRVCVNGNVVSSLQTRAVAFNARRSLKKTAFTLAEVLITLGVIGVVAAVTMPTLIQNHRRHVVENKLAKFYSVMNQAVKLSETEYGEHIYWDNSFKGYDNDSMLAWWNKYFAPHVQTIKTELEDGKSGYLDIYFPDGSKAQLLNHTLTSGAVSSAIHIFYYTEANAKSYRIGKNGFCFLLNTSNQKTLMIEPYGRNLSKSSLLNNSSFGCKKTVSDARYCTELIRQNGWKIPKDYPFKL